jgi:MFS family permease
MTYVILIVAALLCEVSCNLPVGSLPLALADEGASRSSIAIAMGSGMFAALFVSVPLGMIVDRVGRLAVLRVAAAASVLVMIAMSCMHGIIAGCFLMAFRSAVLVAYMTAQFTYASNIFAKERAVSAVGTMGIIGNVAFASGPALGVYLWQHGVHREQYFFACILNVVAALLVFALPAKYDVFTQRPAKRRIIFRAAWVPAMAYILSCTLQGGVNGALAVLAFQDRGIANGATIFSASAITTVLFRYPAGRLVERFGARTMAIPTALFQGVGCILASHAASMPAVIAAGMCLGTAWSAVVPIGLALFFETSSHRSRGIAMGSYNLAFGGGAALGALVATIATMMHAGYTEAITICALAPCLALMLLLTAKRKKAPARAPAATQESAV